MKGLGANRRAQYMMRRRGLALLLVMTLAFLPALPQRAVAALPAGGTQPLVLSVEHCAAMMLEQGMTAGHHKAGKAPSPARCPMDATCLLMHGALPPTALAGLVPGTPMLPFALAVRPLAGVTPPTLTGPPRAFA